MGAASGWHALIVLAILALVFGTKKLRDSSRDLGEALKAFNEQAVKQEDKPLAASSKEQAES